MKNDLCACDSIYLEAGKVQEAIKILKDNGIKPWESGNPLYLLIESEVQYFIDYVNENKFGSISKKYRNQMIEDITENIYNDYDDVLQSLVECIQLELDNYEIDKTNKNQNDIKFTIKIKKLK